ncbi:MAG: anaerobic ribonucleoside-triphosphate reductase activating protein [Clostridia bacterium]|nr:anaerobic ribonucleoside-triphosphate reductase activating protein [Clostridia bacterium]
MIICGMEKFSMVDYDGYIACTVFTKGCNFLCPFCHNSSLVTGDAAEIPESEVFDYLTKRKGLVDAVCITGGEPTLQRGLKEFILKVRALGYRVKMDTNGTNPALLRELLTEGLLDYVAMDIKTDFDHYEDVTGTSNPVLLDRVRESVHILKELAPDYEFRTTAIAEYHSADRFPAIAEIVRGAKRFFVQKFKDGENNLTQGILHELPKEEAEKFLAAVRAVGVAQVGLRGY